MISKGVLENENIGIKPENKFVTYNLILAHSFNTHNVNSVENTSECSHPECKPEDHKAVTKIIERYKNHRNTEAIISSEIEQ